LWEKSCRECHDPSGTAAGQLPVIPPVNLKASWMPHASFSHAPHLMVECTACHAADRSRLTSDVLMPQMATCASCHAPAKGAESRCFECHAYHDWSKGQAVKPHFRLSDFSQ
ncbi:MAG: cytochrome C, partial [Acidobacteria bacterium]|nr:cytochrome C [Acidobacteriota bacterium]